MLKGEFFNLFPGLVAAPAGIVSWNYIAVGMFTFDLAGAGIDSGDARAPAHRVPGDAVETCVLVIKLGKGYGVEWARFKDGGTGGTKTIEPGLIKGMVLDICQSRMMVNPSLVNLIDSCNNWSRRRTDQKDIGDEWKG